MTWWHSVWLVLAVWHAASLQSMHAFRSLSRPSSLRRHNTLSMEIFEGNPVGKKIWDAVWQLPLFKASPQGQSPTSFGDAALVLKNNILQLYGNETSYDGAPLAEGEVSGLLEGSLFLGLRTYYEKVRSLLTIMLSLEIWCLITCFLSSTEEYIS